MDVAARRNRTLFRWIMVTLLAVLLGFALYGIIGMIVAIPALMFHRYFKGRIHGYVVEMEQEASALLDTLDGRPGVMNPAAAVRSSNAATAKA